MSCYEDRGYIPRRTLEVDFPAPLISYELLSLPGPSNVPLVNQAVRWKTTPMGWDAESQVWYTGLTNGNNRQIYNRWYQWHKKRELKTLPHGVSGAYTAYAQHLRETAWYDPTLPAQYLHYRTRWGAFEWNDKPIPGKEYVVDRNRFKQNEGLTYFPLPNIGLG